MIEFVKHNKIDKVKWDNCINNSVNGLIYAKSFYLDNISPDWNALVLDDYAAVMPLPWRKKLLIRYLYQPSFFQQGGIFSAAKISKDIVDKFISKASVHYRYIDITLNYLNDLDQNSNALITKRNNYILNLDGEAFSNVAVRDGFKQALANSNKQDLQYAKSSDYFRAIKMYKNLYSEKMRSVSNEDYLKFGNICKHLKHEENLIIRTINSNNDLTALVLLLKDKNRLYNVISCITEEGKKQNANYFLYYNLIKEFSGSNLILDLEGSDIPGVEFFYKRITDLNQPYSSVIINNLPFGIKK